MFKLSKKEWEHFWLQTGTLSKQGGGRTMTFLCGESFSYTSYIQKILDQFTTPPILTNKELLKI